MSFRNRRLHTYLASLPAGPRSFPSCQVKGNVLDETLNWLAEVEGSIDPAIEGWLSDARPLGRTREWVPEALLNAISLSVIDAGYPSDESWVLDVHRRQLEAYRTPLYRALLMVLSPTLLTMGASDRWKAYRQGSTLVVDKWQKTPEGRAATATLRYPPGLHTEVLLLALGQALLAAVDACGARGSRLEMAPGSGPGESRFFLTYES